MGRYAVLFAVCTGVALLALSVDGAPVCPDIVKELNDAADIRFEQLNTLLNEDRTATAVIAGEGGSVPPGDSASFHNLGTGLAIGQWNSACKKDGHNAGSKGNAAFVDHVTQLVVVLMMQHPKRVTLGRVDYKYTKVGGGSKHPNYQVWGANMGNWDPTGRVGDSIIGGGQATYVKTYAKEIFGLVTTPMSGYKGLVAATKSWSMAVGGSKTSTTTESDSNEASGLPSSGGGDGDAVPKIEDVNQSPKGQSLRNTGDDCFLDSMIFPMFAGTSANDYLIDPEADKADGQTEEGKKMRADLRHVVNEFRGGRRVSVTTLREDIGRRDDVDFSGSQQDAAAAWGHIVDDLERDTKYRLTKKIDTYVAPTMEDLDKDEGHLLVRTEKERTEVATTNVLQVHYADSILQSVLNSAVTTKSDIGIAPDDLNAIRVRDGPATLEDVIPKEMHKMYYNHQDKTYQIRHKDTDAPLTGWNSVQDGRYRPDFYTRSMEKNDRYEKVQDEIVKANKSPQDIIREEYAKSGRTGDLPKRHEIIVKQSTAVKKKAVSADENMFWGTATMAARVKLYQDDKYSKRLVTAATKVGAMMYYDLDGGNKIDVRIDADAPDTAAQGIVDASRPILEVAMLDSANDEKRANALMLKWLKELENKRGDEMPLNDVLGADFDDRKMQAEAQRPDPEVLKNPTPAGIDVPEHDHSEEYQLADEVHGTQLFAKLKSKIDRAPPTLIVRLHRKIGDRKKLFRVDTRMDLTPISTPAARTKLWELSGMTLYWSETGKNGHYVSFARYPDGKWYYQNDSTGRVQPWYAYVAEMQARGPKSKKIKKMLGCKKMKVNAVGAFEDFLDGDVFLNKCDKRVKKIVKDTRAEINGQFYAGYYSPAEQQPDQLAASSDELGDGGSVEGSSESLGL